MHVHTNTHTHTLALTRIQSKFIVCRDGSGTHSHNTANIPHSGICSEFPHMAHGANHKHISRVAWVSSSPGADRRPCFSRCWRFRMLKMLEYHIWICKIQMASAYRRVKLHPISIVRAGGCGRVRASGCRILSLSVFRAPAVHMEDALEVTRLEY